ncbi:MAG: thermonuclease family protein [Deltaproteobacteria bacterium]|nr:thermonuclease family protein [Deltaproteobacteria bacterium]
MVKNNEIRTDKKLKIDKPRNSFFRSELFYWIIGAIAIIVAIFLFIYLVNNKKELKEKTVEIITGKNDMSFFNPFPARRAPAPPVKTEPAPVTEPVNKINPANPARYFVLQEPQIKPVKIDPAAAINNARYGAAQVKVSTAVFINESNNQKNETKIKKETWANEARDHASYPLNMSRILTVNRFIKANLINEINSELPGKVIAQIEENVYGAHGRKILFPAGTQAIGRYNPISKVGSERMAILWQRFITPDGINIHTGDAEMVDQMGRSGISGEVDNRYWDRYGLALFTSVIGSMSAYAMPVKTNAQAVVIENFGREQQSFAKKILDEHMEIRPKIIIPAGSRILITASRDIWFPEAQAGQIYAEATPELAELKNKNIVKIINVVDGDTVDFIDDNKKYRVRIVGIDTPERGQCFYSEATERMKQLVLNKNVNLVKSNIGKNKGYYGRLLRYVYINNQDIGASMVQDGYAISLKKYNHDKLQQYNELEKQAIKKTQGIWRICKNQ